MGAKDVIIRHLLGTENWYSSSRCSESDGRYFAACL